MAKCFRLSNFEIRFHQNGNTIVLVSGDPIYHSLIINAFPHLRCSPAWEDRFNSFDWGFYINEVNHDERENVAELLDKFKSVVYIEDILSQTFALDYHTASILGKTPIGQIIYNTKYKQDGSEISIVIDKFMDFITSHPTYHQSELVISVPSSGKGRSLPNYFAQEIADRLQIINGSRSVRKVKKTLPMKDIETAAEKFDNIRGAFEVIDTEAIRNKKILLIDDIYQSGMTLHELATTLQRLGATTLGLVATKTLRDIE